MGELGYRPDGAEAEAEGGAVDCMDCLICGRGAM
jgi:hypothetical protein